MKILHISKYFPPKYGGIENQAKYICDYLYKKKINIEVLAFGKKTNVVLNKYKIFKVKPLFTILSQPISFNFFLIARKLIKRNQIIHFHYPNIIGLLICFLFCTNQKLIIHWHSDVISQKYLNKFFYLIEKSLFKRAVKIVFTSNVYARNFKYFNTYKKKISIISCGSKDLNKEFNSKKSYKKKFKILQKKFKNYKLIYSVGRLVHYKGFRYLIKSAKYLDDKTKIIIAGEGYLYKKLKKIIKDEKLEDKVHLIGKISFGLNLSYLKLCRIFCLPSITRNEAFGVAIIEAMSFSKPIISTKIKASGINWVNRHNNTGFVVPIKNPVKIATAIKLFFENQSLYKKMSLNSKKRYIKYFNLNIMNRNFYQLYKELYARK